MSETTTDPATASESGGMDDDKNRGFSAVALALGFVVVGVGAAVMATSFPDRAGIVPITVAVPMTALALFIVISETRHLRRPRRSSLAIAIRTNPFLWLGAFTALFYLVGAVASLGVFGAALAQVRGRQPWRLVVPIVAVTTAVFFVIVEVLLGESLYRGVFLERIS
ncbi:hypothetical protein J4H86_18890 [Spiractinospora alimapuensis]|uniref:hypothetical protein n=1 Tax=Spiractinospora alimapuensis TaxID=2820884 RepID=UPI001F465249|nr:hypothetical protein [Spiractinospora alimapuensis]QVQ50911.1 hypothetical protein J4H86_18890 [Spiractinospora alimapuensis]